ncbi:hypothetical protein ACJ2_42430 [Pantoea sp. QMID2]|nr:hypothetical protein ACJ3_42440 [Pantoea sp. QMID3]GME47521.1 hypothetical protein ACJ1_42760 [Pantoea sp. QMID1]GME62159.1 hypothetical protein ACJ4_42330 [Pantoea sp. QMID4]GME63490.1 hypothetical protein ACJ2_42430 [Pantoea sp. QMID2]
MLAEVACYKMGETWWPPERPFCSQGCHWLFDRGSVWLKNIVLLDQRDADTLSRLCFIDEWGLAVRRMRPSFVTVTTASG